MRSVKITALLLATLVGLSAQPSNAQLVAVTKQYRVRKLDPMHNRIEVTYLTTEDPVLFVEVDGLTHVLRGSQVVPWTDLQPGSTVTVKGGLTMDLKVHARTIIIDPSP